MPLTAECLCCNELPQSSDLLESTEHSCLTELDDYQAHIHPAVLETFFKMNRKNWKRNNKPHGPGRILSNRQYRLVAYRHVLEWILQGEVLGSRNRVAMPACIVTFIRKKFPSNDGQYTGFKWPSPDEL